MNKGKTAMGRKTKRLTLGVETKTTEKVTTTRTYPIRDFTGKKPVRGIHYHD